MGGGGSVGSSMTLAVPAVTINREDAGLEGRKGEGSDLG